MTDHNLPSTFRRFATQFPGVVACHENMAKAVDAAGPLDAKTRALIKIGICVGAEMESALRSHVQSARQAGATKPEIEQAILQAMNTCGFHRTVAAWSWAQIQFQRDDHSEAAGPAGASAVRISVKLFGPQAHVANTDEVRLTFEHDPTCAQVLDALGDSCPEISRTLSGSRLAVNQGFATPEAIVRESDEVALIGLVGGG